MRESLHRPTRSNRESTVVADPISSRSLRDELRKLLGHGLSLVTALLLWPTIAFAQGSPWERAASNLEFTFTGPLARCRNRRDTFFESQPSISSARRDSRPRPPRLELRPPAILADEQR